MFVIRCYSFLWRAKKGVSLSFDRQYELLEFYSVTLSSDDEVWITAIAGNQTEVKV